MEQPKDKLERYEDAALARIMDEYAQADGQHLLEEYERAEKDEEAPALSPRQYQDGLERIRAAFRSQKKRERLGRFSRIAAKAAACLLVVGSLAAATIIAVDADNRVSVDRFLTNGCSLSEMQDRYVVHFRLYPATEVQDREKISALLREFIPEEYTLETEYSNMYGSAENPGLYSRYRNAQGQVVRLDSAMSISGKHIVYKDGCTATELSYLGYDMVLVEWEDAREIFWLDDAEGLRYSIYAQGLSERKFWDLVFEIARA